MSSTISQKDFRNALGLFTTGIAVVTATHAEERVGFTINSFASVSLEPSLVLFSAGRHLRSYQAIESVEGFAINILREDQRHLSSQFSRAGIDKWENVGSQPGGHGGHVIDDCLVSFDCRTHARYECGDHLIVVGEVVAIHTVPEHRPLVYFRSNYYGLEIGANTPAPHGVRHESHSS